MIDAALIDPFLLRTWQLVSSDSGKVIIALITVGSWLAIAREVIDLLHLDLVTLPGALSTPSIQFRRRKRKAVAAGTILAALSLVGPFLYLYLALMYPASKLLSIPLGSSRVWLLVLMFIVVVIIVLHLYFYFQVAILKKLARPKS